MRFNDPTRPQLALGRPCWEHAPGLVLPELAFRPTSERGVFLMILVGGGFWRAREVKGEDILSLLHDWDDSPERFLKDHWDAEAPRGLMQGRGGFVESSQVTGKKFIEQSADELGF